VSAKALPGPAAMAALAGNPPRRPDPVTCMTQAVGDADRKICAVTGKQETRVNDCGVDVYLRMKAKGAYSDRYVKPGASWSQCLLPQFDPGVVAYKFCYADEADRCKGAF